MMKNLAAVIVAMMMFFINTECTAQDKTIFFIFEHNKSESIARFPAGTQVYLSVLANKMKGYHKAYTRLPGVLPGTSYRDHVTNWFYAPEPSGHYKISYVCTVVDPDGRSHEEAFLQLQFDVTGTSKVVRIAASCVVDGGGHVSVDAKPIVEE